ncbi:hypothetical protein ACTFIW_000891 [Dictyostelium discoideum]
MPEFSVRKPERVQHKNRWEESIANFLTSSNNPLFFTCQEAILKLSEERKCYRRSREPQSGVFDSCAGKSPLYGSVVGPCPCPSCRKNYSKRAVAIRSSHHQLNERGASTKSAYFSTSAYQIKNLKFRVPWVALSNGISSIFSIAQQSLGQHIDQKRPYHSDVLEKCKCKSRDF